MLLEWCATLLLGNLLAVRGGQASADGTAEPLLGQGSCGGVAGDAGHTASCGGGGLGDMAMRLLVINVLAYPAPQLGLGVYLLLEARSLSEQPILAWLCCEKPTPAAIRPLAQEAWHRTHMRTGQPALAV